MHKLMIKTHRITGMKYLCYTRKDDLAFKSYRGSGKRWLEHLEEFGDEIDTEIIFSTNNIEEFREEARRISYLYDVVESEEWANLKIEEGDGGSTTHNKRWITDGSINLYVDRNSVLPDGFRYGRSGCVFNDSEKQKEFGSRALSENRRTAMTNAWKDGKMNKRDNSRCGVKGDANPAKRPEVRAKTSSSMKKRSHQLSEQAKMNRPWEARWGKKSD